MSEVNNFYGTDITVPNEFFETFENSDRGLIEKTTVENGWISENDIAIADKIVDDITNKGFDIAMKNLENEILSLNLGEEEFIKKNTFVNLLKIDNEENSSFLNKAHSKDLCYLCCLWAGIVLLLSLASLLSCVTWIMCGFAIYGVYTAIDYMFEQCER
ncbi:hypothetical protein [Polaribacter aestuariivivens]|uniref:hypothetical protein n=1 Tax=Polaribacter aestuariivivens TaxID=2304626 RepID=UPI003F4968EF